MLRHCCLLLLLVSTARADSLSAAEIMQRVAANQDRVQKERANYIYHQHALVASRQSNGKSMRDETSETTVTPSDKGITLKRDSIAGHYRDKKKQYLSFKGEPIPDPDSIDAGIVKSMRDDLTNDNTKDGLAKGMFPLTTDAQKDLAFTLQGETTSAQRSPSVLLPPR